MNFSHSALIQNGRRKLWIPVCVFVVILSLFTGIFVGWEGRVRSFTDTGYSVNWNGRYISFDINLVSVDSTAGTLVLDWYIYNDSACDQLGQSNSNNASICSPFVKIFLDPNILRSTVDPSNPADNNIPTNPVFQWNATANNNGDDRTSIPAFRSSMTLLTTGNAAASLTNQQNYPFDSYYCDLFVFAQDASNATVSVRIHSTSGVAVGYTAKTQRAADTDPLPDINDMIAISRSGLVKTYVLAIVISMWAITLVFVIATVISIFFGYRQKVELLAIPVTVLFAFPQLRSSMPGAPLGGTIVDYVGVLPCLALTSLCAAMTLGFVVFVDPEENREHVITTRQRNQVNHKINDNDRSAEASQS